MLEIELSADDFLALERNEEICVDGRSLGAQPSTFHGCHLGGDGLDALREGDTFEVWDSFNDRWVRLVPLYAPEDIRPLAGEDLDADEPPTGPIDPLRLIAEVRALREIRDRRAAYLTQPDLPPARRARVTDKHEEVLARLAHLEPCLPGIGVDPDAPLPPPTGEELAERARTYAGAQQHVRAEMQSVTEGSERELWMLLQMHALALKREQAEASLRDAGLPRATPDELEPPDRDVALYEERRLRRRAGPGGGESPQAHADRVHADLAANGLVLRRLGIDPAAPLPSPSRRELELAVRALDSNRDSALADLQELQPGSPYADAVQRRLRQIADERSDVVERLEAWHG